MIVESARVKRFFNKIVGESAEIHSFTPMLVLSVVYLLNSA